MKKTEKRAIQLHFHTKIEHGDHIESYEFTTDGELYHKGSNDYLRFKEKLSDTDTVQTTMKWDGQELMLIRQGVILMRQGFAAGEERRGRYVTPEASWETVATTDHLLLKWPKDGKKGYLQLTYQFILQGQHTGTHHVSMTLEEERTE